MALRVAFSEMASETEASCIGDPNFAVICSFLERFAESCGISHPNFAELQEMLENSEDVDAQLVELHVKLLRKARKSVSAEKWERALIKFGHTYSSQDGWELERFGYKKAALATKLRVLKSLLEAQFDLNARFKAAINKLTASELRTKPLGRDQKGQVYWGQQDSALNLRVYQEDEEEESWTLIAKDREDLARLIETLSGGRIDAKALTTGEDADEEEEEEEESSSDIDGEEVLLDTGQPEQAKPPGEIRDQQPAANVTEAGEEGDSSKENSGPTETNETAPIESPKAGVDERSQNAAGEVNTSIPSLLPDASKRPTPNPPSEQNTKKFKNDEEGEEDEVGEAIEEPVMHVSGLGAGAECDTGNPGETKSEQQASSSKTDPPNPPPANTSTSQEEVGTKTEGDSRPSIYSPSKGTVWSIDQICAPTKSTSAPLGMYFGTLSTPFSLSSTPAPGASTDTTSSQPHTSKTKDGASENPPVEEDKVCFSDAASVEPQTEKNESAEVTEKLSADSETGESATLKAGELKSAEESEGKITEEGSKVEEVPKENQEKESSTRLCIPEIMVTHYASPAPVSPAVHDKVEETTSKTSFSVEALATSSRVEEAEPSAVEVSAPGEPTPQVDSSEIQESEPSVQPEPFVMKEEPTPQVDSSEIQESEPSVQPEPFAMQEEPTPQVNSSEIQESDQQDVTPMEVKPPVPESVPETSLGADPEAETEPILPSIQPDQQASTPNEAVASSSPAFEPQPEPETINVAPVEETPVLSEEPPAAAETIPEPEQVPELTAEPETINVAMVEETPASSEEPPAAAETIPELTAEPETINVAPVEESVEETPVSSAEPPAAAETIPEPEQVPELTAEPETINVAMVEGTSVSSAEPPAAAETIPEPEQVPELTAEPVQEAMPETSIPIVHKSPVEIPEPSTEPEISEEMPKSIPEVSLQVCTEPEMTQNASEVSMEPEVRQEIAQPVTESMEVDVNVAESSVAVCEVQKPPCEEIQEPKERTTEPEVATAELVLELDVEKPTIPIVTISEEVNCKDLSEESVKVECADKTSPGHLKSPPGVKSSRRKSLEAISMGLFAEKIKSSSEGAGVSEVHAMTSNDLTKPPVLEEEMVLESKPAVALKEAAEETSASEAVVEPEISSEISDKPETVPEIPESAKSTEIKVEEQMEVDDREEPSAETDKATRKRGRPPSVETVKVAEEKAASPVPRKRGRPPSRSASVEVPKEESEDDVVKKNSVEESAEEKGGLRTRGRSTRSASKEEKSAEQAEEGKLEEIPEAEEISKEAKFEETEAKLKEEAPVTIASALSFDYNPPAESSDDQGAGSPLLIDENRKTPARSGRPQRAVRGRGRPSRRGIGAPGSPGTPTAGVESSAETPGTPKTAGRGRGRGRGVVRGRRLEDLASGEGADSHGSSTDPGASPSDNMPVLRQSRRIAQIKQKEEEERRVAEAAALEEMQRRRELELSRQQEQASSSDDESDSESDQDTGANGETKRGRKKGKKRGRKKAKDEDYIGVADEDIESLRKKKKKKKKRKKKKRRAGANPWESSDSSDSSSQQSEGLGEMEEEEDDDEPRGELKSDHEFSPESDLELGPGDAELTPAPRRARTARRASTEKGGKRAAKDVAAESEEEEDEDQYKCQKCGGDDRPEWILLCDSCDVGWHTTCLRPELHLVPEGDWFCPECSHQKLISSLTQTLRELDKAARRKMSQDLRRQRLAYVGISLDNVLPARGEEEASDEEDEPEDPLQGAESEADSDLAAAMNEDGSDEGSEGSGSATATSSSSSESEQEEELYPLRQRRVAQTVSYKFQEYDDLINEAIQDEMEEVKGAGNAGRGKDIANIVNANASEENEEKKDDVAPEETAAVAGAEVPVKKPPIACKEPKDGSQEESQEDEEEETDDDDEDVQARRQRHLQLVKLSHRRKPRRLACLDVSSEDDHESDEDFHGSSEEASEDEDLSDVSADYEPVRRSTRARQSRQDRDFINDDSDSSLEERRKRKGKRPRGWLGSDEESDSESTSGSEDSWGGRAKKRKRKAARARAPAKRRKRSSGGGKRRKKGKKGVSRPKTVDPDAKPRVKKPKPPPRDEPSPDPEPPQRRATRGKKINYQEIVGSDSDDATPQRGKGRRIISDDEDEFRPDEEEEVPLADRAGSSKVDAPVTVATVSGMPSAPLKNELAPSLGLPEKLAEPTDPGSDSPVPTTHPGLMGAATVGAPITSPTKTRGAGRGGKPRGRGRGRPPSSEFPGRAAFNKITVSSNSEEEGSDSDMLPTTLPSGQTTPMKQSPVPSLSAGPVMTGAPPGALSAVSRPQDPQQQQYPGGGVISRLLQAPIPPPSASQSPFTAAAAASIAAKYYPNQQPAPPQQPPVGYPSPQRAPPRYPGNPQVPYRPPMRMRGGPPMPGPYPAQPGLLDSGEKSLTPPPGYVRPPGPAGPRNPQFQQRAPFQPPPPYGGPPPPPHATQPPSHGAPQPQPYFSPYPVQQPPPDEPQFYPEHFPGGVPPQDVAYQQEAPRQRDEEGSGEFGGLVSYFSSQREDDLDP